MNQNNQDIDEHLLLQYLLGNADITVRERVEKWMEADGRNRKHLDRLEALWLETGKLDPPPLAVDLPKAWDRLSSRIEKHEAGQPARQKRSAGIRYLKFALSAAALILLSIGIYVIMRSYTGKVKEIEMVATAAVVYDTLPDNSHITLNKNSKLEYPDRFEGGKRLIKLTGEAFFEVTKDPSKPFVVDAGPAKVKVLGTRFNMSAYPGQDIQVTVTEGRVLFFTLDTLTGDTASITLEAGMSGMLVKGALKPVFVEKAAPDRLYWATHALEFKGIPLAEVFAMVEKYYDVKISADTPDILNCRLSASFENDPVNHIMTVIADSFGLKLSVEGNTYHLSGDGCSKSNN
jgi:transmembrane sensor